MRQSHWLTVCASAFALAFALQAQAQQSSSDQAQPSNNQAQTQQSGTTAQTLEQAAQKKADEAKNLAEQTKEKAKEARSLAHEAQMQNQQNQQAQQTQQSQQTQQAQQEGPMKTSALFRASDVLGMEVRSRDNQKLGKIQDLTIDPRSGHISYAAISSGGVLGVGNKLVAVPWSSLQLHRGQGDQSNERFAMLNVQKSDFDRAPTFASDNWPTSQDQIWQVGSEREEMDTNVERQQQQSQQQAQQRQHEQQMREQQQRDRQQQEQREQQQREEQQRQQQQNQQHQQQNR